MTQAVNPCLRHNRAPGLPTYYRLLWRLLDAQMRADFDELQWQSDPDEPWEDWDDRSRLVWLEYIQEIDDLSPIDRLRMEWAALWQSAKAA